MGGEGENPESFDDLDIVREIVSGWCGGKGTMTTT